MYLVQVTLPVAASGVPCEAAGCAHGLVVSIRTVVVRAADLSANA